MKHSDKFRSKDVVITPNESLKLLTIPSEEYEERRDWLTLGKQSLARAYSDDEPEYDLDSIKELNPDYEKNLY